MWLENFTFAMPAWLLVVFAWLPVTLWALTLRLYALPEVNKDQERLLGLAFRFASTAYVFFAGLSVNALWSQNLAIFQAWEKVIFEARYLESLVSSKAAAASGDMTNLLNNGDTYLRSDEVLTDPLTAIGFFTGPGSEVMNKVTAAAQSAEDVELLTTSYRDLVQNGQDYLAVLNAPGIPDVYFIAIVLVGLVVAGLIAVHPPRVPTKFSTLMLLAAVFLVGLLQLPLWVLNSRYFERRLLDTLRFDQPTSTAATGQTVVIILVALLLIAAVALLTWRARRQREAIINEE